MVYNLILTEKHKIGINKEKFMLNDEKVDIKDVSFIRYRFNKYTEGEANYIEEMMNKFNYSTHLAEVYLYPGFSSDINALTDRFDNLAIFLYISIDDDDVRDNSISDYYKDLLEEAYDEEVAFDRIVVKDKSTSLFTVSANKIKKMIKDITEADDYEVGFCESPLSRYDGNACLTAVRARELAAKYNENDKSALPSANHECKNSNGCGCIKHTIVDHDLEAPVDKEKSKKPKTKNIKKDGENKEGIGNKAKKKEAPKKRAPERIIPSLVKW